MAQTVYHPADSRGRTDFGWLQARPSFSFGQYHNPERIHFGALRVLNDDRIAAGAGFGTHPHDNMEIITIPLEGSLRHRDSMGNTAVIERGKVQVMSAGTGIEHSEYNASKEEELKLLQIWLFPNKKGVTPRYDEVEVDTSIRNAWVQILSPNAEDAGVWIHQDAWFHLGRLDKDTSLEYTLKKPGNGVYAFPIAGEGIIEGQALGTRDGFGIWDVDKFTFTATAPDTEVLLMEVPMEW